MKLLLNNQGKTSENINDLLDYYNSTLQNLTDKYAPLQCKTITLHPIHPGTRVQEKRVHRRSERIEPRTQREIDQQILQYMYRRRNEQLANTTYFTNKVDESKDDLKALFRLTRNMMGNSGDTIPFFSYL